LVTRDSHCLPNFAVYLMQTASFDYLTLWGLLSSRCFCYCFTSKSKCFWRQWISLCMTSSELQFSYSHLLF
jgi:hypothetical protein